jgi:hypothetical protein
MKTVSVSARSRSIRGLLAQASQGNLILRAPDGREFILAEIDDFNREIELTRQNRALMKLLETRSKPKKRIPLAEARRQLGLRKSAAA